jgi:hypothetical protein
MPVGAGVAVVVGAVVGDPVAVGVLTAGDLALSGGAGEQAPAAAATNTAIATLGIGFSSKHNVYQREQARSRRLRL